MINMLKNIITTFIYKKLTPRVGHYVLMFDHNNHPIVLMDIISEDYAADMFEINRSFSSIYHVDLEFHNCKDGNCWTGNN